MYPQLHEYLLQHKQLPVPGIGTFYVERQSAELDFINKRIMPPVYAIALKSGSQLPSPQFFKWLARALGITDRDAVFQFNDFVFDLKLCAYLSVSCSIQIIL